MSGTSETLCTGSWTSSGLSPQPISFWIMDALTAGIRKDTLWQMMFVDDIVLCATDIDMLNDDLGIWRDAIQKREMKISRTKTEYMYLNGKARGSINMQAAQFLIVTELIILEVPCKKDGGMEAEVKGRVQTGCNNWKKMSGIICDKIQSKVKGNHLQDGCAASHVICHGESACDKQAG